MSRWGQHTPKGWHRVRRGVLQRDSYTCQLRHTGCTDEGTEVHHLEGVASLGITRDSDEALDPDACIAVCSQCHKVETGRQSAQARHARAHRAPPMHPADAASKPRRCCDRTLEEDVR